MNFINKRYISDIKALSKVITSMIVNKAVTVKEKMNELMAICSRPLTCVAVLR